MDLDVDVGKLPNHLKLCVLYSTLFYHPTVSKQTEIHRAVRLMRFHYYPKKNPTYNWRRLWGLHFKLRHCDVSVHQQKVQG
jgi:hypothetical protein